jgi:hypothetical protein
MIRSYFGFSGTAVTRQEASIFLIYNLFGTFSAGGRAAPQEPKNNRILIDKNRLIPEIMAMPNAPTATDAG